MKFSIIIQAWQDRGFMDECIMSAINQTFEDYEIIISSDGNMDLKKYADKYGVDFVFTSKCNHANAMNNAILKCSGEWIKCIDDDDLIPRTALSDVWENRSGDLIHGDVILFGEQGERLYKSRPDVNLDIFLPIMTNPINWAGVYFKRNSFIEAGCFDSNVHYGVDCDLYLNFITKGYKFVYLNKIIGYYRKHLNQMTNMATYYKASESIYLKEKYKSCLP